MNLQTSLGTKHNVIVDGRASKRDVAVPDEITVESSYLIGPRATIIDSLVRAEVKPVVFVDSDSNVWVLTAGGSGVVMFESADEKPLDEVQSEAVDAVVRALEDEFNIRKPKKPRKKKEDDVVLGVVEPEYPFEWSDVIADVEDE